MDETKLHRPTGAMKDPDDGRDILYRTIAPPTAGEPLPRKFSLRDKLGKAPMQKYGSCVGFAGKNAMQYYLWKATQILRNLSGRFLYGQAKKFDGYAGEGTWPRIMLKVMFGVGAVEDNEWPQEPSPTHEEYIKEPPQEILDKAGETLMNGGFARVLNYQELKDAIYKYGPVLVSLQVLETYDSVGTDGHIKPATGQYNRGGHENIAIGWDDDGNNGTGEIELMNNWDITWGDNGFAFMPLNYMPGTPMPLYDMWLMTDQVDATGTKGAPVNLAYPVDTDKPVVTQAFGANFKDANGQWHYKNAGGHSGIDFRTRDLKNRFITATDDGEVILAANNGYMGLAVIIKHAWGLSYYMHNSKLLVSDGGAAGPGSMVKKGQRIAVPGATGDTGTPPAEHCHFAIKINGVKRPQNSDFVDPTPYFGKENMTKYFRVEQHGKSGIMILEGFSGTLLFENDWTEYQTLLKITGNIENVPLVKIPDGRFFRLNDHGKLGIMVVEGFSGTVLFENAYAEYLTLLQISGLTPTSPEVVLP